MSVIKFYGHKNPYGEFSNFYERPIVIRSLLDASETTWPTTEHYFQAQKSDDPAVQEHVRTIATPGEAKRYCTHQVKLIPQWEHFVNCAPEQLERYSDARGVVVERVKDHFMFQALIAKFTQHEDLGRLLLGTGDAEIVEDTQKVGSDSYWGNGPSGNGLNKLGRMLVLVRAHLGRHMPHLVG